jgi:hypothetical protein
MLLICSNFCFNMKIQRHIKYAYMPNKLAPCLALGMHAINLPSLVHATYVYNCPFEKLADGV